MDASIDLTFSIFDYFFTKCINTVVDDDETQMPETEQSASKEKRKKHKKGKVS